MAPIPNSKRKYEELWQRIAAASSATVPVKVTCHRNNVDRIKRAVKKEKVLAGNIRKNFGMPTFGRLTTHTVFLGSDKAQIHFTLQFNGDML